ncbi:MAG: 7TM-DISM domain-containing protein, partial [Pseudomonadota bacterium]
MRIFSTLLAFIMVFFTSCFPATAIDINSEFSSKKIESIHYSFTPTSLEDAQQSNLQQWQSLNNKPLNLGLETRPVWIKFQLNNYLNKPTEPILSLDNPLLNNVYLYHFMGEKQLKSEHLGD